MYEQQRHRHSILDPFQALDDKAVKQINGKMTEALTINGTRFMFLRVAEEDDGTYQIYCKLHG